MTTRPFKRETILRVTNGKFRGWRGSRYKCDNDHGTRYYSLFALERHTKRGIIYARTVGLVMIINIPEHHLKAVRQ